jgi:hypothetical protein
MREADVEEGVREGFTLAEQTKPLERPQWNRLSERETYILRRAAAYLDQTILPKVLGIPVSTCENASVTTGSQTQGAKSPTRTRPLIRP